MENQNCQCKLSLEVLEVLEDRGDVGLEGLEVLQGLRDLCECGHPQHLYVR